MAFVLPQQKLSPFKPPHDANAQDIIIEQVFRASSQWGITITDPSQIQRSGLTSHYANTMEDHENVTLQRRRIFEWRSAANTDPSACHNLAIALFRGEMGVEKNPTEAAKYFTLAAKMGNVNSAFNLGWQYANANGVKQSWTNAVKWWTFAAEGNHSSAARNIGLLYSLGMVPHDFNPSTDPSAIATATGNTMNDGNKTQSAQNTPNFERAFFWYTRAYELGNWKAAAAIANMYRQGQHVEKSEEMALKFDQKSAQLQAQQQNQVQNDGIN